MKNILVPTDFSNHANHALDFAKQVAKKNGASIKLLHVVEQASAPYLTAVSGGFHDQMDNVYVLNLLEKVKSQLQLLVSELQMDGVQAKYKIKIGNPFGKITDQIQSEDYDLIIMGTKGTSGIQEVLVGSNTERVVRHANCPVITLKESVKLKDIKDLVFAVNFFEKNDHLAAELEKIQQLFAAKIHLVTINTPANFIISRDVKKCLGDFAERHNLENFSINNYSDITEEEGIRHFAEDQQVDMIVMATHGRTGIRHLLSDSISEQVVNHATLPVITFPLTNKQKKKATSKEVLL